MNTASYLFEIDILCLCTFILSMIVLFTENYPVPSLEKLTGIKLIFIGSFVMFIILTVVILLFFIPFKFGV